MIGILKSVGLFLWSMLDSIASAVMRILPGWMIGPETKYEWALIAAIAVVSAMLISSLFIVGLMHREVWLRTKRTKEVRSWCKKMIIPFLVSLIVGKVMFDIFDKIPDLPGPTQAQILASLNKHDDVVLFDSERGQAVFIDGDNEEGCNNLGCLNVINIDHGHIIELQSHTLNPKKESLEWRWNDQNSSSLDDGYLIRTRYLAEPKKP